MARADLSRRLAALEASQGPSHAAIADAAERFTTKFLEIVDRLQGQDPGPLGAPVERIAARFWHDPAGAVAEIKEMARHVSRH